MNAQPMKSYALILPMYIFNLKKKLGTVPCSCVCKTVFDFCNIKMVQIKLLAEYIIKWFDICKDIAV